MGRVGAGVWELPEGWGLKRIKETLWMRSGSVDPRKHPGDVFELYSMPAYDTNMTPEIVPGSDIGSSKKLLRPGDCLLSRLNPRIPRVWIVGADQGRRQVSSTDFVVLVDRNRPNGETWFEPSFLRYMLLSQGFRDQVVHGVQGATGSRQRLRSEDIALAKLPVPPLTEQRRIVARIEELSARIEEAGRLRAAAGRDADQLTPAALKEVFSKTEDKGWSNQTIGDLIKGKPQYGTSQKASEKPVGVPVLRMGNIVDGQVSFDSLKYMDLPPDEEVKYLLHEGDILFNRTNSAELVGKSAVYPGDRQAVFASYLIRVVADPDKALPHFVVAYINSPLGRQYIQSQLTRAIGQVNVNAKKLQAMPIPVPPLPEQRRTVEYLDSIQDEVAELKHIQAESAAELEHLEGAILARAFRGEL